MILTFNTPMIIITQLKFIRISNSSSPRLQQGPVVDVVYYLNWTPSQKQSIT